jgi:DNA adenine methylase
VEPCAGFGFREPPPQRRLAEVFRALDKRGCLLLLSNSETPLIRRLYEGFRVETVLAARAINSKGSGRDKIAEVVVRNFG